VTARILLLPGDGIGPEVVEAGRRVLEAVAAAEGLRLEFSQALVGGAAIEAHGTPLRDEDLDRCRQADAVLLGAVGGPAWDSYPPAFRPERGLLRLRSELELALNLRPVRWAAGAPVPLREEMARGADIVFVRELTGGIYFGRPSGVSGEKPNREAVDTAAYSEGQIRAALDFAFALARQRRGLVTSVDKANVMSTSHLWRQVAADYAAHHPDVQLEHALVDSFAMSLMRSPIRYDVVVTDNLFGDILTDLGGVLAGSLGVLPSASVQAAWHRRPGLYEPVHGSAPDIAGLGIANPVGMILSVALMLRWSLDRPDLARRVETAVEAVMAAGCLTADLAPSPHDAISTDDFTGAVIQYLHEEGGSHDRGHLRHHVA
jgi:3-isopropylmalate dehydrogenase